MTSLEELTERLAKRHMDAKAACEALRAAEPARYRNASDDEVAEVLIDRLRLREFQIEERFRKMIKSNAKAKAKQ